MQKIMFNDKFGLTKAVLEGRKTQTRRLALHSKEDVQVLDCLNLKPEDNSFVQYVIDKYSRYKIRETVAVAQSYEDLNKEYISNFNCELVENGVIKSTGTPINIDDPVSDSPINYWGDEPTKMCSSCKKQEDCFEKYFRWIGVPSFENKMFVKAEFMLHQIRITGIRLERLQDISTEDCLKEGIIEDCPGVQYSFPTEIGYCGQYPFNTPRAAYAALIDKISGKGTWERNPWVFVYDFEVVK